jgi:hypothetical protein
VIEKGITAETLVVVDGLQRARPGLEVSITERTLEVEDQALLRGLTPTGLSGPPATEGGTSSESDTNESNE